MCTQLEVDIILSHELVQFDVLLIEPPLFPVWSQVCGNAGIAKRRVKLV